MQHVSESHFHIKGCAPRLRFRKRLKADSEMAHFPLKKEKYILNVIAASLTRHLDVVAQQF